MKFFIGRTTSGRSESEESNPCMEEPNYGQIPRTAPRAAPSASSLLATPSWLGTQQN